MLITTVQRTTPHVEARARELAEELGGRYEPRNRRSLVRLREECDAGDVLTVAEHALCFYAKHGDARNPLFFHPSMAAVRIKRLQQGETDNLLTCCAIAAGDAVLDCTAGMASDSVVLSYAVGEKGSVLAVESEPVTALIAREGLRTYTSEIAGLEAAMRRIELVQAAHMELLSALPAGSFDIVYFDPMFRHAKQASSWISPLRQMANAEALQQEALDHAVRVARKRVVVKELRGSKEFARLGISDVRRFSGDIAFGVIQR